MKIPKSLQFRACVYPSPDVDGLFVAHCLELDLIGEGNTPQEAVSELLTAIELQIDSCDDISQLAFFAPLSIWQKYKSGKATPVLLTRVGKHKAEKRKRREARIKLENIKATNEAYAHV